MSNDSSGTGSGIVDRALIYSRYGLRVFPVHAEQKRPMPGYGWVELASSQTQHVVEDFLRAVEIWGEDSVSVAWALGLDGYMAVDIDVDQAEWPEFIGGLVPEAAINQTKRGVHLIFQMPGDFDCGNGTSKFPSQDWGEVRGKGGYVVIAGPDRPGLDIAQLEHAHPFPFPEWLSEYGGKTDVATKDEVRQFMADHNTASRPNKIESIRKACDDWNPVFAGDPRRGRHPFAIWVATCAAEDALAGYYAAEPAFKLIKQWWQKVVPQERWGREFDGIITWAVGKAWANAGVTPNPTVEPDTDEAPDLFADDNTYRPTPIEWSTWRDRDRDDHEWLVEGFWPRKRAMLLAAKAGQGKSQLMIHVAASLALGVDPFNGRQVDPVRVAYIDLELDNDQVDDYLADLGFDDSYDLSRLENLRYFVLPQLEPLSTRLGGQQFLNIIDEERVDAVIIDTFSRVVRGEGVNDDRPVLDFYTYTGLGLKQRGIGYIRLDHLGKDPTKGAIGTSMKSTDVDYVWFLKRINDKGRIKLWTDKTRGLVDDPLLLERYVDPMVAFRREVDVAGMSPGVAVVDLIKVMDRLGIDPSWGRRKAVEALVAGGEKPGRPGTLQEAIRIRRDQVQRGVVTPETVARRRLELVVDNDDEDA